MCACTHTHAAGKINPQHDRGGPATTAARELEEETHGLLPAALTLPLLLQCPVMYWHGGKMALYLLRCSDGELLPAMYTARVAGATYERQGAAVCTRQGGALCAAITSPSDAIMCARSAYHKCTYTWARVCAACQLAAIADKLRGLTPPRFCMQLQPA